MTHPILKWPGGKRQLLPEILARFPEGFDTYREPFIGGGAVFFAQADRMRTLGVEMVVSDFNPELSNLYTVVRDHLDELIPYLRYHTIKHSEDAGHYHKVRAQDPSARIERAARTIYLNKTCFNGTYRVNAAGKFNQAKGDYENPAILDEPALRSASMALHGVEIKTGDFEETITVDDICPMEGDFIYCDPPYHGTWTGYTPGGFDDAAQTRVRNAAAEWASAGANVLISNSNTTFIRDLYAGDPFRASEVSARRSGSCTTSGRGNVTELLITTYPCAGHLPDQTDLFCHAREGDDDEEL